MAWPLKISVFARQAMLQELNTTPKPGLVDRRDKGAHTDMDYSCFRRSIDAVAPYLASAAALAAGQSPNQYLWRNVRMIGCEAENAMFEATAGVNTHKGQIFVLMTLIAAAASEDFSGVPGLQQGIRSLVRGIVEHELVLGLEKKTELSHGEKLYITYGLTGIRGEAEAGFPIIFEYALPVYMEMLDSGYSLNDASLQALLSIMCNAEDTTIVHRGGLEALEYVQTSSRKALALGGICSRAGKNYVSDLNREFIRLGISPGGCADLLAGTIFVYKAVKTRRE